jgi:AraC family transcriptional regulator
MPITVDVKTLPPMTVACLHHVGSVDDIDAAMRDALAQAKTHGLLGAAAKPVRLCHDIARPTAPDQRHFDAGVMVANTATDCGPLHRTEVKGGTYAVVLHRGPHAGVGKTYGWLLDTWLPDSGYAVRPGPSVEVFVNDPADTVGSDLMTEIRVPIRPAA